MTGHRSTNRQTDAVDVAIVMFQACVFSKGSLLQLQTCMQLQILGLVSNT